MALRGQFSMARDNGAGDAADLAAARPLRLSVRPRPALAMSDRVSLVSALAEFVPPGLVSPGSSLCGPSDSKREPPYAGPRVMVRGIGNGR